MSSLGASAPRLLRRVMTEARRRGGTLSPELEAAAAQRLGALALIVGLVTALVGTGMYLAGPVGILSVPLRTGIVALNVGLSLGLFAAIRLGGLAPHRALQIGAAYQVVHALLAALPFHSLTQVPGVSVRGWTPVAVWVMLFPALVPAPPRRVILGTLATAAMDPLALIVTIALGGPRPSPLDLGHLFFPTLLTALLAPIGARIVYGLTVEVRRAREMGSYRLLAKLGEGGMGEVWRAEHRMLARGAAIKLIRPQALGAHGGDDAQDLVKRFEREARATAALRSPHTIEVYDYGVATDGTFHYVMELLEGFSLQALVERFGPVPPERAVHLLRQACHSLAEAHAQGLVHRDIKPANLFVCRLGLDVDFVKVLDFGLVKLRGPLAEGAAALTLDGSFAGTPAYIPPEVALGAEVVDGRADLYALGCVAYWLLTGQRVFEGTVLQMLVDHVRTPPVPPSERTTRAIPRDLEALVLRCLEKDPAHRPASARALSTELGALGLEERWTAAQAGRWWAEFGPESAARDAAAEAPDRDLSGEETWSRIPAPFSPS